METKAYSQSLYLIFYTMYTLYLYNIPKLLLYKLKRAYKAFKHYSMLNIALITEFQ